MRMILEDFYYRGCYFDHCAMEIPNDRIDDEILKERISQCMFDNLEMSIGFKETE